MKKEYKIKYRKNFAGSWCGSAYFVNDITGKDYTITFVAAPDRVQKVAKPLIQKELEERTKVYLMENPCFRRVNYDEYEEFRKSHSGGRYDV
jgi:hypothetical protein